MSITKKIINLETFLAYSIALEEEAADRHDELADMLDVHNNPGVATTFRKLAHYSRLHAQEIRDHAKGRSLPVIAPCESPWVTNSGRMISIFRSARKALTRKFRPWPVNLPKRKKNTWNC